MVLDGVGDWYVGTAMEAVHKKREGKEVAETTTVAEATAVAEKAVERGSRSHVVPAGRIPLAWA